MSEHSNIDPDNPPQGVIDEFEAELDSYIEDFTRNLRTAVEENDSAGER